MRSVIRAVTALTLSLALGAVLVACGGGGTPAPTVSKVSAEATEFAFAPNALEAKAGQVLEITLVNKGTLEHDFTIDALGVKAYAAVGKSATATTASAVTAGTYDFYCSIAGHKEAGMTGTIVVK